MPNERNTIRSKSGLKKYGHRSHCSGWKYMVKASSRFATKLQHEACTLQRKYSKVKGLGLKSGKHTIKDLFNDKTNI